MKQKCNPNFQMKIIQSLDISSSSFYFATIFKQKNFCEFMRERSNKTSSFGLNGIFVKILLVFGLVPSDLFCQYLLYNGEVATYTFSGWWQLIPFIERGGGNLYLSQNAGIATYTFFMTRDFRILNVNYSKCF